MAAVQRGEVDVIIVYTLWRNRRERAEGIEILRKHEVSVLCVRGPELDLTTAAGRLLAGLLGEVEQMPEREQRETPQRVERGLPPTGPRCFGYTADGAELVEDEAAEVRDCFHALLAGATLSGMAADLNERGILNRNGSCSLARASSTAGLTEELGVFQTARLPRHQGHRHVDRIQVNREGNGRSHQVPAHPS
ncbi:DNA invertase Pin-like site-specific DNA recombinase [Streptomyces sp. LBL]|uniref:recombinase family protein n=1 Tax=Streptomyces sp. LBL TaxID=2940562 RepID=UPI002475125A|nr:recombinase family protein [Streptomyces sp. LBL]MDH6630399.1 DNA invertase Pin-like site-specific DNA recombinase [Streptomyces sp. LBL]